MTATVVEFQPAYVLHSRPYRDTSLLLELLTYDYGRVSVVARGARQMRSSYRGILQPFIPLLISWFGKSELHTLRGAEINNGCLIFEGDKLLSGLYINELIVKILHRYDPHPQLYLSYAELMKNLSNLNTKQTTAMQGLLRKFEVYLLQELGYAFSLTRDYKNSESIQSDSFYIFEPLQGLTRISHYRHDAFIGRSLLAFAADNLNETKVLHDAKRLMRTAISHLLGEKTLKIYEFV